MERKLPAGCRFAPTEEEILLHYLNNKIHGLPLSTSAVIDCDLYGEKNAWMKFFEDTREKVLHFFTKLKKKSEKGSRVERVTSCGTWRSQSDTPMFKWRNNIKERIGSRRNFSFVPKEGSIVKGRWVMHEFRRSDRDDLVLCRIYKKKASKKEEINDVDGTVSVSMNVDNTVVSKPAPDQLMSGIKEEMGNMRNTARNQPSNTLWNTADDLEKLLFDSSTSDETNSDFEEPGLSLEELDDIIAKP